MGFSDIRVRLMGELWRGVGCGPLRPATLSPVTVQNHRELVAALLAVEGVASASVEPVGGGPGTLRLRLSPGTDEVAVAGTVNRLLRARFGLAVDADRVRVLDESHASPPKQPAAEPESRTAETPAHGGRAAEGQSHAGQSHEGHGHEGPPHVGAAHEDPVHKDQAMTAEAPRPASAPEAVAAQVVPEAPAETVQSREPGTAMSEPEAAAHRVESSMPEPGGAVITGSGGAFPLLEDPTLGVARPGRLAIQRVELVSAGLGVAVTVALTRQGRTIVGEAEGAATQTGVHRSVATATLRAVETVAEGLARFEVEHIEITRSGPDQTVLVVLTMVTGRSNQRLSGTSVVREDVRQAVVRAVLDAVNRRMEPMLVSS